MIVERVSMQMHSASGKPVTVPCHGNLHQRPFLMAIFGCRWRATSVGTANSFLTYNPTCEPSNEGTGSSVIDPTPNFCSVPTSLLLFYLLIYSKFAYCQKSTLWPCRRVCTWRPLKDALKPCTLETTHYTPDSKLLHTFLPTKDFAFQPFNPRGVWIQQSQGLSPWPRSSPTFSRE